MKAIKWLDNYAEEVLMTLLLIGIAAIMIIQVAARYVFNSSLSWSDELTRYFLVWSAFLSVSFCVKKQISIKINQLQNALPEKMIPWIKMVRHTIVLIFCIIMIPYALTYVQQAISSGATSSALKLPMYYIQSAPLVCFILLAIRVAQAWLREFRRSAAGMAASVKESMKAEPLESMKAREEAELSAAGKTAGGPEITGSGSSASQNTTAKEDERP